MTGDSRGGRDVAGSGTGPLASLFDPDSVAVVGASTGREGLGGRIIGYLDDHGYRGTVHPVNPKYEAVHGRDCAASVTDLPGSPTVAFVIVPAPAVPGVVRECGEAGVEYVVVGSSGFAEAGAPEREADLAALADEYGFRLLGPNCEGVIDPHASLALSFSSACKLDLRPGRLGVVSQSGGLGGALLQIAHRGGVGASKWVTTGNEADVSLLDVLEHYVEDPSVGYAVAVIEAVGDGRRFLDVGRRALETGTPVLALKLGDSALGRSATRSHTGRVSGPSEVYAAALAETGIVDLRSVQDYVDALETFSTVPPDRYPEGPGLGVVSASGGACALIADACERYGLDLPALPEATVDRLSGALPAYGSPQNPIDLTGRVLTEPELFETCLETVAEADAVDAVLLQVGNSGPEHVDGVRETLYRVGQSTGKPVFVAFTGGWPDGELLADLRAHGVPAFQDGVAAVRTLGELHRWNAARHAHGRASGSGSGSGTGPAADRPGVEPVELGGEWTRLARQAAEFGVDVVSHRTAGSVEAAVEAAADLGYPVTVKLSSAEVSHRTELGGVHTDRRTGSELREAAADLLDVAEREGIDDAELLVQAHATGFEVLCGVRYTGEFGPVMVVGPGGEHVELFGDDAREYVFLPADEATIRERLTDGRLGEILAGHRRGGLALDALAATAHGLSRLALAAERGLEANPVIVDGERAVVVDLLGTDEPERR